MASWSSVRKIALGLGAGAVALVTLRRLRDERSIAALWRALESTDESGEVFTAGMVADLPDPARRYFLHAIQPGTPLASTLHWRYSGSMKPARQLPWMSLSARQVSARLRGFVWRARAWKGPLFLTVDDLYADGAGRTRVALFGLIPLVNATGADLSKSARGRLLIEGIMLPAALLPGPRVQIDAIDASRFTATVDLDGEAPPLTLTVDADGRLQEATLQRWGNLTPDGSFRPIPYGCTVTGEGSFDGYTIPTEVTIGWWYGTEQYEEVVRLHIDAARFD